MTHIYSIALALSLALGTAACGGAAESAEPAMPAKAQPTSAPSADDVKALCVDIFTRNRTCTDTYIPALVDLRAKYDKPPGIAEKVKADRDGIIAQAKTEWASDSRDEAIAATCTKITSTLSEAERSTVAEARDCLAQSECSGFTACIMPHLEKRFAK